MHNSVLILKLLRAIILFLTGAVAASAAPDFFHVAADAQGTFPPTGSFGAAAGSIFVHESETTVTITVRAAGLTGSSAIASVFDGEAHFFEVRSGLFSTDTTVSAKQLAALRAGRWSLRISTPAFPTGEIGGIFRPATDGRTIEFPSSSGTTDDTFGIGGKVVTEMRGSNNAAQAVVIQPDGKIVVAGFDRGVNEDFAVARYNPDGSLDKGFGFNGFVTTAATAGEEAALAVTLDSDGRIVIAGQVFDGGNSDIGVVRYNPDGSLDTSFDGDGFLRTSVGPGNDIARAVKVQADGRIVVAGSSFNGVNNDVVAVRYNPDGSLDPTFGGDGIVTTAAGNGNDFGYALAIQADGRIVVAGYAFNGINNDALLVRYTAAGTLDPEFGGDGIVTASAGTNTDEAFAVAIQDDGRIVFAGCTNSFAPNDFLIGRLNSDGSRDVSFGSDGLTVTPIGGGAEFANGVAVQPDGKIVAAGFSNNGTNNDFALVRKNRDGSTDTGFGINGRVTSSFGDLTDSANGVAIQADGKIVAVGRTVRQTADFGVIRYGYGTNTAGNDSFVDLDPRVDVRFENAFGRGAISSLPINSAGLPPLPAGSFHMITPRRIATTAGFGGEIILKLSLSERFSASQFAGARVLNFENGRWIDRTVAVPAREFSSRTLFGIVSRLSVVAVVSPEAIPPPLVMGAKISGFDNRTAFAVLTQIDSGLPPAVSRTNPFGFFRFRDLNVLGPYLIDIASKNRGVCRLVINADDDEPLSIAFAGGQFPCTY